MNVDVSYKLLNGKFPNFDQCNWIDVALKQLKYKTIIRRYIYSYPRRTMLVVLDVLSKEGKKIFSRPERYKQVHGATFDDCLFHFCSRFNCHRYANFIQRWIYRFLSYSIEQDLNPEKETKLHGQQLYLLYYFFIYHGQCITINKEYCYNLL